MLESMAAVNVCVEGTNAVDWCIGVYALRYVLLEILYILVMVTAWRISRISNRSEALVMLRPTAIAGRRMQQQEWAECRAAWL